MNLVIAYLHNDRLVCKCDFDYKSLYQNHNLHKSEKAKP